MVKKICPGKTVECKEFWQALIEYRNTPNKDGLSPAERLFSRPMRTRLPAHPQSFHAVLRKQIREADRKAILLRAKAKQRYNAGARELDHLEVGDIVRVQHHVSKRWDLIGEIVKKQPRFRSYLVKSETGRLYWRNRRFIRPFVGEEEKKAEDPPEARGKDLPRRGTRNRKQTDFFRP